MIDIVIAISVCRLHLYHQRSAVGTYSKANKYGEVGKG